MIIHFSLKHRSKRGPNKSLSASFLLIIPQIKIKSVKLRRTLSTYTDFFTLSVQEIVRTSLAHCRKCTDSIFTGENCSLSNSFLVNLRYL